MVKSSGFIILTVSAFALNAVEAQSSHRSRSGPFAGIELSPLVISTDKYISDSSARTQAAMGLGAQVGMRSSFGLAPFIRVEGAVAPRENGAYRLLNFNYGLRWSIVPLNRLLRGKIPYVEVAFNNRIIRQDNVKVEGRYYPDLPGPGSEVPFPQVASESLETLVGAGIELPIARSALIQLGVSRTKGQFDSIRFGGLPVSGWNFDGTDYRLHAGLQWIRSRAK